MMTLTMTFLPEENLIIVPQYWQIKREAILSDFTVGLMDNKKIVKLVADKLTLIDKKTNEIIKELRKEKYAKQ